MKLKDIARTATFAWDQTSSSSPLLVTGAVAGALDESFSNESQLEIWAPSFSDTEGVKLGGAEGKGPEGSITVSSRFNRLAWGAPSPTHPKGLIAAGMETGEVHVYDPEKIIVGKSADESRIYTSHKHTGPVRGLDFNPIQKNLLASGAVNAEIYIYDLNNPTKEPVTPGPVSNKLGEITSLQWNPTVARILAASSSSGYTSVWDLKAGKEIVSLQYGGGAAKGRDAVAGGAGLQVGKRRGMSDVCWHPEQSTRLITSSEDDESPIIMLWDLRNTRAPERILSGHSKGVLSVSWCRQDPDLLLSCGKDNRTLCWNPQSGEIIGELPATNDWAFQTTWCPRNPDLLATASFDGHIGIHSLQTTHIPEQAGPSISETATADDVFGALGSQEPTEDNSNVLSLKQPPKWLKRPISATFGYGGLLATTSNLPSASGKHQSGVVHLRNIVTEQSIIERAQALDEAGGDKDKLAELCTKKVDEDAAWKTLSTLFKADSRDELIKMLGFSKDDVARQVDEAIKQFPADRIPTVTFAEPELENEATEEEVETPKETEIRGTPSEVSLTSDTTKRTEATEQTEQSLFDDEAPAAGGGADFFSSMASGTTPLRNPLIDGIVPHKQGAASSVAATVGSRASSVRSETIKDNNFRIYPSGESDVDRLVTQALVLGDFKSAVDLCLASERFADALLLAVRGGPELLASTQKAYFNRRTTSLPFLRVFQSIVTEDLADIVQNADLAEWKVVFVVLCTFAKDSDFNNLAEQLGQRLQFRSRVFFNSDSPEAQQSAKEARGDATLCYLAARRLEKVVGIWIDEMREEEESSQSTRYSAHAHALQSFIEKVAVFQAATGYTDQDLAHPTESAVAAETGARSYRLAGLYDRFYEYADLLATQGQVDMAAKYVQMTPSDYKGTGAGGSELDKARDRLFRAAGINEGSVQAGINAAFAKMSVASGSGSKAVPAPAQNTYGGYQPQPQAPAQATGYAPQSAPVSAPVSAASVQSNTNNPYAPPAATYGGYSDQSAYAPQQSQPQQGYQSSYGGSNGYPGDPQPQGYGGGYAPNQQPQQQPYGVPQQQQYGAPSQQQSYGAPPAQTPLAPPPRAGLNSSTSTPPIPAAQRRDMPGWNDAPQFAPPPKRPQSAAKEHKPAPIMSPFPNSGPDPMAQAGMAIQGQGPPRATPPPPRNQPGVLPPPPKGAPRPPSAQAVARQTQPTPQQAGPPPQPRPTPPPARGGPPPGTFAGPPPVGNMAGGPPPRALSPLGPGRAAQQPQSISAGFRPTPPSGQGQGGPRPDGLSPPQGSQARMGGPPPPPPGRGAGGPPPPKASTPTPRPISVPPKPAHPQGDRSHIPASSKPIYDVLSSELGRVKQINHPAPIQRIVDDTERRLNILFDGLNNETVPKSAVDKMHEIARAISSKDANAALGLHVQLLTDASGDMTTWAPGVKQLIRLGL